MPEIYREHRHRFSKQPEDIDAYKRQVMYRAGHIGTKELEIVLMDYLKINQDNMTYADVEKFDYEILSVENPLLQRYLLNGERIMEDHIRNDSMGKLLDYISARKKDYHGNIPKDIDL